MTRKSIPLAPLLAIACIAAGVRGQVPEGWYVLARAADPINGTGGISLLQPRTANSALAVTGVPLGLLGAVGLPGSGASAVVVEPGQTGRILAGNVPGVVGDGVYVHMMSLVGNGVSAVTTFFLGIAATVGAGVTQIADFGSFAVAAVNNLNNTAPLSGQRLAYLDKANGAVYPIPITGLPLMDPGLNPIFTTTTPINCIAKAGPPAMPNTLLYLGVIDSATGRSRIFSLPVPGGGTPSLFVPYYYTGIMTNMSVKPTGEIYSAFNAAAGSTNVWVYNSVTPLLGSGGSVFPGGGLNGIATESTTYGYAVLQIGGPTGYQARIIHPVGSGANPGYYTYTTLATATAGTAASGASTGIDWNPTPTIYGAPSPLANTYSWNVGEFELGMPFVGSDFTLRATSTPGTSWGWFAVSWNTASLPAFGITLNIDPASLIELRPMYPGTSWINMSSYMIPLAAGTTFECQAFYFEPAGLAASEGVRFRVQ